MLIITLLLLLFYLFNILLLEKRISICFLYCFLWSIVIFLSSLRLLNASLYSERVYVILLLGITFFLIGYLLFSKISFYKNSKIRELNSRNIIIFLSFNIFFYLIQAKKVISLMLQGVSFSAIRYSYYTQGKIMSNIETIISTWIVLPMIYFLIVPINLVNYQKNKKNKKIILYLSLLNIILYLFVTQGKQNLIYYIFSIFLFQFFHNRRNLKKIYKIIFILLALILVLQKLRHDKMDISFIYTYIGTSLKLLDYWSYKIDNFNFYSYGMGLFYGIINLLSQGLEMFKITMFTNKFNEVKEMYNYIISTGIEVFYKKGSINNVYVTNQIFFYGDGRFLGIILDNFLYGSFIGASTVYYKKNKSLEGTMIFYNIIGVGVLYTFISWAFYNTSYCVSLIMLYFFITTKKIKKRE